MTYESDPPRLSDLATDASPELSRLFRNARRDVPNDAELGNLLGRLGPMLGAGIASAGDALQSASTQTAQAAQVAASPSSAGLFKLLGGLVSAGIVASGAAWFAASSDDPKPAASAPARAATPAPVLERAPEPAAVTPAPASEPEPKAASSAALDNRSAKRAASPAPGNDADREARLLEQARASIDANPQRALSLTREHARRFPQGVLAQEREVIAIEALRRLGRGSEAETRVDQFQKAYPGSAHQRALGTGPHEK